MLGPPTTHTVLNPQRTTVSSYFEMPVLFPRFPLRAYHTSRVPLSEHYCREEADSYHGLRVSQLACIMAAGTPI